MDSLRIGLIQTELHWFQPKENRQHLSELIDRLSGQADIIVLPETFTSGFTHEPDEIAEASDGESAQWMIEQAKQHDCAIVGSHAVRVDDQIFNRLQFATGDGIVGHYDKRHLFGMGGEHLRYTPGTKRTIIDYKGWRILPQICYDLRFPVWMRNRHDYDLILLVANWPTARRSAWSTLLAARAIENQAYVVGLNRVGSDANNLSYSGDSVVLDPMGAKLMDMGQANGVGVEICQMERLKEIRTQLKFLADGDSFSME